MQSRIVQKSVVSFSNVDFADVREDGILLLRPLISTKADYDTLVLLLEQYKEKFME